MTTPAENDNRKPRSPNYPVMPLKEALDRVGLLYRENHEHAVRASVAVSTLGYGPKSSGGIQALATLSAFGLIVTDGRGDERTVRVSKDAVVILNDEPESLRRRAAIKRAALTPPAHDALWKKFGRQLPGDAAIRGYLTIDLKFLPDGADLLIKEFKETFVFAGLDIPDYDDATSQKSEGDSTQDPIKPPPAQYPQHPPKPPVTNNADIKQDVFTVAHGNVTVSWPSHLGGSDILDIEEYWPILLRKIKRSLQAENPSDPPEHPANSGNRG